MTIILVLSVWFGTALAATDQSIRIGVKKGTASNVIVVHTAAAVLENNRITSIVAEAVQAKLGE